MPARNVCEWRLPTRCALLAWPAACLLVLVAAPSGGQSSGPAPESDNLHPVYWSAPGGHRIAEDADHDLMIRVNRRAGVEGALDVYWGNFGDSISDGSLRISAPRPATPEVDYTVHAPNPLHIPANENSREIRIHTINNHILEGNKGIRVVVERVVADGNTIYRSTAIDEGIGIGIMEDERVTISVTVPPSPVNEGENAVFTFSLTTEEYVTERTTSALVFYAVENEGATATYGKDFDIRGLYAPPISHWIYGSSAIFEMVFGVGETEKIIRIPVESDKFSEPEETFTVVILTDHIVFGFGSEWTEFSNTSATVRIAESDPLRLRLPAGPVRVSEGGTADFPLTIAGGLRQEDVTVRFTITEGSATSGTDYTVPEATEIEVIIPASEQAGGDGGRGKKFTHPGLSVVTLGDGDNTEGVETFNVSIELVDPDSISMPIRVVRSTTIGEISDTGSEADALAATITTPTPPEVDEDAGVVVFTVNLPESVAAGKTVLVDWEVDDTDDIEYHAARDQDYTIAGATDTLSIDAGDSYGNITVSITDDALLEGPETLQLTLTGISYEGEDEHEGFVPDSADVVINDNERVTFSIAEPSGEFMEEGNNANFTVSMELVASPPGGEATLAIPVSGIYTVTGAPTVAEAGAATPGEDVFPDLGEFEFLVGDPEDKSLLIEVRDDDYSELAEAFTVTLGLPGAEFHGLETMRISPDAGSATATIQRSDRLMLSLPSTWPSINEGDIAEIPLTVSGGLRQEAMIVDFSIAHIRTSDEDFVTSRDFEFTIPPSDPVTGTIEPEDHMVRIETRDDDFVEEVEEFSLGAAVDAGSMWYEHVLDTTATESSIISDDTAPTRLVLTLDPSTVRVSDGVTTVNVNGSFEGGDEGVAFSRDLVGFITIDDNQLQSRYDGAGFAADLVADFTIMKGETMGTGSFTFIPTTDRYRSDITLPASVQASVVFDSTTYPEIPAALRSPDSRTLAIDDDENLVTVVQLEVDQDPLQEGDNHTEVDHDTLQESDAPTEFKLTAFFAGTGTVPDVQVRIPLVFSGPDGAYHIKAGDCSTTPGPGDTPPSAVTISAEEPTKTVAFCIDPIDTPGVTPSRVLTIDAAAGFNVPPVTSVLPDTITITDDDTSPTGIWLSIDTPASGTIAETAGPAEVTVRATFTGPGSPTLGEDEVITLEFETLPHPWSHSAPENFSDIIGAGAVVTTYRAGGRTCSETERNLETNPVTVTIDTGKSSGEVSFCLKPDNDRIFERDRRLRIDNAPKYKTYFVEKVDLTIAENESHPNGFIIELEPLEVLETGGFVPVKVTAHLTGGDASTLREDIPLRMEIGGSGSTATTDDYTLDMTNLKTFGGDTQLDVIVPSGERTGSATFRILLIRDDLPENDETIQIGASWISYGFISFSAFVIGSHAELTIRDGDTAPTGIRYRVDGQGRVSVAEGGPPVEIMVTAELMCGTEVCEAGGPAFAFPVTLPVQGYGPPHGYDGPAAESRDYQNSPHELSIVIAEGSHSGQLSMTFTPGDDSTVEDDEAVAYAASGGGALHLGADGTIVPAVDAVYTLTQQPAYIVIEDDDAPTITLTASPRAVDEGRNVPVTLTAAFPPGTAFELEDDVTIDVQVRSPLNPHRDAARGLGYALGPIGIEDWALDCVAFQSIADDAEQIVRIRTPLTIATSRGEGSGSLSLCFEALGDLLHEGDENVVLSGFSGGDPLREDDSDRSGRFIVTPEVLTIRDAEAALPGPIALLVHAPASAAVNEGAGGVPVTLEARLPEDGAVLSEDLELTVRMRQGNAGEARYRDEDYSGPLRPDYEQVSPFTIVIPAGHRGARSSEFTLVPIDDNFVERDKTIPITGRVETTPYAGISVTGTRLTLVDDDRENPGGVELTVEPVTIPEDDAGAEQTTTLRVTATLTDDLRYSQDLVIFPEVSNGAGEALGPSSADPRVSIFAGNGRWHFDDANSGRSRTFTIDVTPRPDNIVEEDVPLTITARVCVTFSCSPERPGIERPYYMTVELTVNSVVVNIEDDDEALVTLEGPAGLVDEGEAAVFVVRLEGSVAGPVSVAWSTSDGSAVAGPDGDYIDVRAGSVELSASPPDLAEQTLAVPVQEDEFSENEEYFSVTLGAITGGDFDGRVRIDDDAGTARATIAANGTITVNLEGPPQGVPEGADAVFRVSLRPEGIVPDGPITLSYGTRDGTAEAGRDYTAAAGTLSFTPLTPGPQEVHVMTLDNNLYDGEGERSFTLFMNDIRGGGERDVQGSGPLAEGEGGYAAPALILDDETPPELHLLANPGEISEAAAGTPRGISTLSVEVRGSAFVEARTVALSFGGDALLGEDYSVSGDSIEVPAGTIGVSNTVQVEVLDDEVDDDNEWILISARVLEEEIEVLGEARQILIHDDDDPWVTVSFAEAFVEIPEGRSRTITARLDAPPEREVVIPLDAFHEGGAGREDYEGVPTELVFGPEDTEQAFTLRVLRDRVEPESGEGVRVVIASPLPERVLLGEPPGVSVSFVELPFGEDVQQALKYALASFGRSVAMSTLDVIEDRFEITDDRPGSSYLAVDGMRVPLGAMRRLPPERKARGGNRPALREVADVLGVRFPRRSDGAGFDSLSDLPTDVADRQAPVRDVSERMGAAGSIGGGEYGSGSGSSLSAPGAWPGGNGGGLGPFSSFESEAWSGNIGGGANFTSASSASTSARNKHSRNIGRGGGEPDMRVRIEPPDSRYLLSRSEFSLTPGAADTVPVDSAWTIWGRSDVRSFDGNPGGHFDLDATTFSGHIGVDYRRSKNLLTGFSLSHTVSDMSYVDASRDSSRGDFRAHLTALNHYSHWSYSENVDLYVVMGEGFGIAEIEEYGKRAKTDINMHTSILGARRGLQRLGAVALAAKADAFLVEVESDALPDISLPKITSHAMRMRAMLEGSTQSTTRGGARLNNKFEMGILLDAGDADRGEGMEFGTEFHYIDDMAGVELSGRWMLAYASGGYQEWGAAVTLNLDPGAPGRGVRLSLAPDWGKPAGGGVDALWRGADLSTGRDAGCGHPCRADRAGGAGHGFGHEPGRGNGGRRRSAAPEQVKMELAYGVGIQGGTFGRVEPFGTWFFEDSGAWNMRLGVRMELSRFARSETGEDLWLLNSLQMEFFNERHTFLYREDEHRIGIKLNAGF